MNNSLFSIQTQMFIKYSFFPNENIKIKPIGKWSPEVCIIFTKTRDVYIGKLYKQSKHQNHMLLCMRQWSKYINETSEICSPEYKASINGNYFPKIIVEGEGYYICIMPKLTYSNSHLQKINDYRKIGKALAILHKSAIPLSWNSDKYFNFLETNSEVESYWSLQTEKEKELFIKTLEIGKQSKFNSLTTQVTHNDIHPENMFQYKNKILFLDFDQMLISPRTNDIGQVVSAFRLDESMATFKKSIELVLDEYTKILALSSEEISLIPYFALRKLCISYVWFKGLANKHDKIAYKSYKIIRKRAFTLGKYLKLI